MVPELFVIRNLAAWEACDGIWRYPAYFLAEGDVAASAAHGSSSEDDGPPRVVLGLPGGVFAQGLDEVSSVSLICSS